MIYIASPYTHPQAEVREKRYQEVEAYLAALLSNRRWAYSPIVHCHYLAAHYELPVDHLFWQEYDLAMMKICDELHVLCIDGWKESKGVQREIDLWKRGEAGYYGYNIHFWQPAGYRRYIPYQEPREVLEFAPLIALSEPSPIISRPSQVYDIYDEPVEAADGEAE